MLIRKNGKDVADWLRQRKIPASLRDYRFLQHDMMFGKRYSTERFFQSHADLYSAGL
ncbi:phosphoglycerol transferase MdoB-like AlkP superfamily enzyme [Sinorhizobium medicae]